MKESDPEMLRLRPALIASVLAVMGSLFVAVRLAYGVEFAVADHEKRLQAIEVEVRCQRDVLIRIDENVKRLLAKEQANAHP